MADTKLIWCGKGVLWHGRKKIRAGDEIPASLNPQVRKKLKESGRIKEVLADDADANPTLTSAKSAEANALAREEAETAAKAAEAEAKKSDVGTLTKAVQTAKGARTKAQKAAEADKGSTELATKATEAEAAVTAADAELKDAHIVAETAVRLRMEADKLTND